MGNEITNQPGTETQTTNQVAEENINQGGTQAGEQEQNTQQEENSNLESNQVQDQENNDGQQEQQQEQEEGDKQPSVEELQAKLQQYELREEEDRKLREKLGIQDVDQQTYNYMNIDQQIVNEGKQVYLRLCNEYGIDANPEKLDASVQELMKTDPAKAYEFQRKFDNLSNEVVARRQEVQVQNAVYEANKFEQEYKQLLDASPALMNIMQQYVQSYGNAGDIYANLKGVMDVIMPAYQEAFNAGRMYGLSNKARSDTSAVQGGVATAQTNTYQPGQVFTREQIRKMSPEEFAKNEKFIQQQMMEGKIQ